MTHPWRPRGRAAAVTVTAVLATVLGSTAVPPASAAPAPAVPAAPASPAAAVTDPTPPTLVPADGRWLEGTVTVASDATTAGDEVTALTVDGEPLEATATPGTSRLSFDVGDNSIETRFGNYLLVNGTRIGLTDAISERVTVEVPNTALRTGDNVVEIRTGAIESSCGLNNDDFTVSEVRLELLGETADGEDNEYTYAMGDGSCGTNPALLTSATLHFFAMGTPGATTGLTAELDTRTLPNGRHRIAATTASGATTAHTVRVNNAPEGAPRVSPVDGTLVAGRQTVTAATSASGSGSVASLLVDGAVPPATTTLAAGDAEVRFTVGSNSIEARYYNHLLVNGHRVEIGGEWVSQTVAVPVPRHYLLPGANEVRIVTGDINSGSGATLCANHDDFDLSAVSLVVDGGTVTGPAAATYAMGDGTCGSSTTRLTEAALSFSVEGAPTARTLPTLGSGEAHLRFLVGGNGTEARYYNHVLVNGNRYDLADHVGVTADLAIPNEWLLPGTNVVEVVAGSIPSECGDNFDDFSLADIVLAPAAGTARLTTRSVTAAGAAVPVAIGDGSCGSSFTGTLRVGLVFDVDAPAQGLRADVPTAQLADGDHTVSATSGSGATATRTLVTDNTAPVVAGSVPATGQRLTSAVAFDLDLDDLAGVAGTPTTLLDGQPLAPGDPVGPGLAAGPHEITVDAVDALGNRATRRIRFTSAGVPDAPTDLRPVPGTTDVARSADLSAVVAVPGGGDVTAQFTAADVVVPTAGFQGTATAVPTTLEVAGEQQVDASSLTPLGTGELAAPAGRDVTFQRFDLRVGGTGATAPVLRWTGTVDPERVVALRAWNATTRAWDMLASSRGALEGDTVLTAPAPARYVDRGAVHVLVTGEDPFADDLEPRNPDGFADPSTYDFSLVHFTDTQYLAEGAVEQESEAERAVWRAAYGATTEWIAEQARDRKIAYVAHTGDITENNIGAPTTPEMQAQVTGEFEVTSELQGTLDRAGVPNQVIAGNHDNQRGLETGPSSTYNQYYGPGRYEAADDAWGQASYGGPWKEGDNQNNYVLFSAGGLEFVAVGLSYGVTREEADWAASVFRRFPERNGILLSHDYLKPSTNPDGRGAAFAAPDGSLLYKLVVESNPNVFLVLAGHEHGVGTNVKAGVGATVTHDVVEMLADYQFYTVSADRLGLTEVGGYAPTDRLRFGASFLRLLQFDVDRGEMVVDTYSPFLEEFDATEHDEDLRYDGTEDDMVLPVDLTSRTTSFTTDDVAAFVPREDLGTSRVASGGTATTTWSGLRPGTTYGWVVSATSAGGGRTASEPAVFRTAPAPAATVTAADATAPYGEDVVVPVTVRPATAGDPVEGTVTVREGERVLGSAAVTDGLARVTVPAGLAPGRHDLVASYAGSGWVGDGRSAFALTVGSAPSSVVAAAPSVTAGQVPTVAVRVDSGAEGVPATGEVRVSEAGRVLGTGTLTDGAALVGLPATLASGPHRLVVDYLGSAQVAAARTSVVLTVRPAPRVASTTTVRATPGAVRRGARVAFAATVRSTAGVPTGRVSLWRAGRQVASAPLAGGRAVLRVRVDAPAGRRPFTLRYAGSATVLPSQDQVVVRVRRR
ncbi:Ig-like domain repeat protein [Nocardioides litoris]|uniref:Ig-like domain repeat protein n=1 Tax=Nocardioides litoris TaxID=1926648 RepID=UPI0011231C9E|nr:Ig-like domain repeat protein [Nocardioides litoris]